MLDFEGVDELWNIIQCVSDESLANDATRFLLDLYYGKQPVKARRSSVLVLHECFLRDFYTRLSQLLCSTLPSSAIVNNEQHIRTLKLCAEQLLTCINNNSNSSDSTERSSSKKSSNHLEKDYSLWLQKIERVLMITEEYIHMVEHEPSPAAHITSFHGLEFQIKVVLGELGKTNVPYDIAVVHSNDTLEMLRSCLAQHYKVLSNDIHISIQNSRPLPNIYESSGSMNTAIIVSSNNTNYSSSSTPPSPNTTVLGPIFNSKYLYELHIHPGTTIYVKIIGGAFNSPIKPANSEPTRLFLTRFSSVFSDDRPPPAIPSNMMSESSKVYDVLYQLSYLNSQKIHHRIRNLLRLMPSDIRISDLLDHVSARAANACTNERRQSTENVSQNAVPINARQAIERVFNFQDCSLIQLLYNLEILTSKISPLSTNTGIQQSSKLFRQDFIEQSGVEFLFKMLNLLNRFNENDYQYSICEEMAILILQLIQLLLCGNSTPTPTLTSRPVSPVAISATDNYLDTIDFDFQATVEHLQFEEFVGQIKQLIFLCWAAAAGNIRLQEQTLTIKEQVKLDRHALLQQINNNVFSRNNSKSSSSSDSSTNQHAIKMVQFGICVRNDSMLPLDCEIAQKIIEIIVFCFEKRPEFIGTKKFTIVHVSLTFVVFLLATFLVQPFFADFLLEILIGTTSREVRQCALKNIIRLCEIEVSTYDIRAMIHQILLKARLPLWSSSSAAARGSNQKLLGQSIEYFDLRCQLTENLSDSAQKTLNINAKELLDGEFQWLSSYSVSTVSNEGRNIDNILFIGHLRFIRYLLTCENVNKNEFGPELIRLLIDQFLFSASKSMHTPLTPSGLTNDMVILNETSDNLVAEPKCSTSESRLAGYEVLVELVRNCPNNLKIVVEDLINLHHRPILEKQTEWEVRDEFSFLLNVNAVFFLYL